MKYMEADILVGKVLKQESNMSFTVKIQYGTRINRASYRGSFLFRPTEIVISGINYSANEMDQVFLDKTLIEKQAMFVVRSTDDSALIGEMFKLPIGDYQGIHVAQNNGSINGADEIHAA